MTNPRERLATRHCALTSEMTTTFKNFSTRSERASRRLEYWRALHPNVDLDVVEKDARNDFKAELLHYTAPDGSTFGMACYDDVVARFAGLDREFVLFSLTLSGTAQIIGSGETEHMISASNGFLALDSTHPLTTVSKRHKHLYLTIPRATVMLALNDNPDVLRNGVLALPSNGVAELLKSHLLITAKEGPRLSAHGAAVAVRCGVDLALETLAQQLNRSGDRVSEGSVATLYTAACRYIQLHLGDSDLTIERIAHAIGCSRAHLHRVFSGRNERVGEVVRMARLEAACTLLVSPVKLSIEQVGHACGFENASSFARAFRGFTGMSPTAYREVGAMRSVF